MKRVAFIFVLLSIMLRAGTVPDDSRQLIVVSSNGWDESRGKLQRYEKRGKRWQKIGDVVFVELGRRGLAWGRGLHHIPKEATNIKQEGDKRAPAGVFELPFAFGVNSLDINYPYKKMDNFDKCVDDGLSVNYNKIVDSRKVPKDYKSYENMKLRSGLYDYGLFVAHNPKQIVGAGSCIFLHIKKGENRPTVGCSAMSKSEIKELILWLDKSKHPVLVQAPKEWINKLVSLD